MVQVIIVVRELGKKSPDYWLPFQLPEVPREGAYISIHRSNKPKPYSEDLIVRKVWWRLEYPEPAATASGELKVGRLEEVFVECDQALGPYASDRWREMMRAAQKRGVFVEEFEVSRTVLRERDLPES